MMINISHDGLNLALLEGQHAEECRLANQLNRRLINVAAEAIALSRRVEASMQRRAEIEAQMAQILDQRRAA